MQSPIGRRENRVPNIQNVPIGTAAGRRASLAFIDPEPPRTSRTPDSGPDVMTRHAAEMFGVPVAEVTPVMRARAKVVKFHEVYGTGPTQFRASLR